MGFDIRFLYGDFWGFCGKNLDLGGLVIFYGLNFFTLVAVESVFLVFGKIERR